MPFASTAELYFIAVMMILMIVFSVVSIYIFFRTYNKEMREKAARKEKEKQKTEEAEIPKESEQD